MCKIQSITLQRGNTQLVRGKSKTDLIECNQIIDMSENPAIYYLK